jgi:GNAT superfamily N-acetyltransferase
MVSNAGYVISTDPGRLDLDRVHAFLAEESYWSPGVPRDVVERAVAGSLVFGAYRGDEQVGFARVVTDRATFAWVCDVFVVPEHRGRAVGKLLVEAIVAHPDLSGIRRLMLATADAHGLYRQFGFRALERPQRYLAIERTAAELFA